MYCVALRNGKVQWIDEFALGLIYFSKLDFCRTVMVSSVLADGLAFDEV